MTDSVDYGEDERRVRERVNDGLLALDGDLRVSYVDEAAARLLGVDAETALGCPVSESVPPLDDGELASRCRTSEERSEPVEFERSLTDEDGRTRLRLYPDDGGVTVRVARVADGRDETPGRLDETKRVRALQRAQATFSNRDDELETRVQELLELGCSVLDMAFGTLSRVQGDEYRFDRVVAPADADLEAGDTVPLDTTNCEQAIADQETLALHDIHRQAPELAERAGNVELGTAAYLGTPVFVDDEPVGTFCFYDREPRAQPFSDWEVVFVEQLCHWVAQALQQRRATERLQALQEVNQVVHEVADGVIEKATGEDIEQRVCESLAAADSYLFAWVGHPDPERQQVEIAARAGPDGRLDGQSGTIDGTEGQGRIDQALQTDELQTRQRLTTVSEFELENELAAAAGFRSAAAIPLVHEESNYGVLNLYTERRDAFEGQEREMVQLLGNIVGHAIAAAERKQALLSESMLDVELRTVNALAGLEVSEPPSDPVEIEAAVPRGDGEYVVFGRAAAEDRAFLEDLVEHLSHWTDLVSVEETDDRLGFEALLTDPPLLSTLASVGGQLDGAVFDDDDMWAEIHLPRQTDVRQTLDALRETYPNTNLVSKQEVTTAGTTETRRADVALEELTDRQLESLRTAYYAGYFEWPRDASGEEVAELLDIAAPTFSQHLREAERTVFGALFDDA